MLAAGAAFAKAAFIAGPESATGGGPYALAVGDIDGDGKADLVVSNADSNSVSVLLGNGDGSFKPQVAYAAGNYPQSLALGDFDNDGKPDIIVANRVSGTVSVVGQRRWHIPAATGICRRFRSRRGRAGRFRG